MLPLRKAPWWALLGAQESPFWAGGASKAATEGCTERPQSQASSLLQGPRAILAALTSRVPGRESLGELGDGAPFTSLSSRPGPVSSGGPSATLHAPEKGYFYKVTPMFTAIYNRQYMETT